jgi:hypothetical protein
LLEESDGSFDDIASSIAREVDRWQFWMELMLVGAVGDDGCDRAFGEPAADAWGAVALVAEQVGGGSALRQKALQQRLEEAALVPLTG